MVPRSHKIEQGDTVAKLAERYGLSPETIWEDPGNAELKALREDMNILAPGDVVVIPALRAETLPCATDQRHVFRRIGVPMLFRIQLLDNSRPRSQVAYTLELADRVLEGYTDGQGCIVRYIPNDTVDGRLVVDGGAVDVLLQFGHMDPVATDDGVRKRLVNLGYTVLPGPDGLSAAVRRFQHDFELPETGKTDAKTLERLRDRHDRVQSA